MRTLLLLAALLLLSSATTFADTLFVKRSVAPGGNGQSWQTAYWSLHDALNAAVAGDEVWVARGTYTPAEGTGITPATAHPFKVPLGVQVVGGFRGTETLKELRDWFRLPAILDAGSTKNSIMVLEGTDSNTVVDGFYFEHGSTEHGGAMTITGGTPFIRNCTFRKNTATGKGGAIYATNVYRVHFEYCTFVQNSATNGGAIAIEGASPNEKSISRPFVAQCAFERNMAMTGGAIDVVNSRYTMIVSCVFVNNIAALQAGCLHADRESWPYFITSTFYNNLCDDTSGADCLALHAGDMKDCIIWYPDTVVRRQIAQLDTAGLDTMFTTNSNCVKDGFEHGFFNFDPDFINAEDPAGPDGFYGTDDDGLYCSPTGNLKDRGFLDRYINARRTDFVGNPRVVERSVDLGAYEIQREGHNKYHDIVEEFKRGGLIHLSRHCATDWGLQDPGPTPECKGERNLIWEGRGQARMIGKVMRANGITISDPTASPLCRTWESCFLMFGGNYRKSDIWRVGGTGTDSPRAKDLSTIPAAGTSRAIVSHDAVILTVVALTSGEINEGDGIIIRPSGTDYEMISHFCSDTWERYRVRFPDGTVSVNEEHIATEGQTLSVYPNPTSDGITLAGPALDAATHVDVVDMTGRTVLSLQPSAWIDLHGIAPGMYLVKVAGQHGTATTAMSVTR